MRRFLLLLAILPLSAAGPQQGITLQVPSNPLTPPLTHVPLHPSSTASPPARFQPAPLPNRNLEDRPARADGETSLRPSLFTRGDTYRGEGFSNGSTANSEQEKRAKPGVGFNLKMPFSPN